MSQSPGTKQTGTTQKRNSVGTVALSLTFLLIGLILASAYWKREENRKLQDAEFLQKQLALLTPSEVKPTARPLALIRVDQAHAGEVPAIREFDGRLLEVKKTVLSSEVTGLLLDFPIEVGDSVKANDTLIAKIDDTWPRFAHQTAERDIELKTSILEFETTEMERLQQLIEERAVSVSEYLQQVNKTDQIRTNLAVSRLLRDEVAEKIRRTEIKSPFDGYVITKMAEIGTLLAPGTPIVQIISSGDIDAAIWVSQTVVDRLRIGDDVAVDIDTIGMKVRGKVFRIVPFAPNVGARMFPVHIRMPNESGRLKSGMSVKARVPESAPQPGIIVPVEAMMDKPDGRTVWVAKNEPAEGDQPERLVVRPVPVKLLAHAVDRCSVLPETAEGKALLVDNALVVIEGSERLTPGQMVEIKELDPRYLENLPRGSGHVMLREETGEREQESGVRRQEEEE